MSKKKKNIRRKKSNNLLKGVAAAGAVVGGGTIFAGNNAVYAAEFDSNSGVNSISESQASTSSYMSESLSQSDSTTEDYASIENSTNASVLSSASDSTVESEKNSIVESNSISDSVSLSESQLTSTSESESTSVSVSDSESLVNFESVKNDEASSNKFGNLFNGLFTGNKNVSAANYTTNTVGDSKTSMSKYFSESESLSNFSSNLTSTYGDTLAGEVLSNKAYFVTSIDPLNKEGVLVQTGDNKYVYTYIISNNSDNEKKTIELTEDNVKFDSNGNVTINWDGYIIGNDGIVPTPFTDYNKKYGNKVFVNVQGKDVYAERRTYDDIDYWVPVKVNGNYIEIQFEEKEDGSKIYKIYNEQYNESYVQIKIGEKNIIWMGLLLKMNNFLH